MPKKQYDDKYQQLNNEHINTVVRERYKNNTEYFLQKNKKFKDNNQDKKHITFFVESTS